MWICQLCHFDKIYVTQKCRIDTTILVFTQYLPIWVIQTTDCWFEATGRIESLKHLMHLNFSPVSYLFNRLDKNGPFPASFSLFSSFLFYWRWTMFYIKFTNDVIRTTGLWCWKRRLCQLSHATALDLLLLYRLIPLNLL